MLCFRGRTRLHCAALKVAMPPFSSSIPGKSPPNHRCASEGPLWRQPGRAEVPTAGAPPCDTAPAGSVRGSPRQGLEVILKTREKASLSCRPTKLCHWEKCGNRQVGLKKRVQSYKSHPLPMNLCHKLLVTPQGSVQESSCCCTIHSPGPRAGIGHSTDE